MRKIILTGAVLAMLTSAAPMVHAQIDQGVQAKLDEKADKDAVNIEKSKWQTMLGDGKNEAGNTGLVTGGTLNKALEGKVGKVDSLDEKINNIQKDLDGRIAANEKLLNGDNGNDRLKKSIEDLKKIVGENENEGLQKDVKENKKLLVGDDGKGGLKKLLVGADGKSGLQKDVGGLKGDIKKLQDAVGDDNSGLQKEVNTIKATAEAQRNVLTTLDTMAKENKKLLEGDNGNGGLKNDVKENKKLLVGDDGNGGLKNDVKENKKLLVGDDGKSGLQKDFGDLKKVVGENENEGLQKAVKENANNITQADKKAAQALTDIAELKAKGNDIAKDIAELGGRINVTGAMSAALAGLKPLQYDPMAPTQVMGSASTYEGQQAYALGLAHFTSENLMVHGGVSFTNSHKYMANVGVTYKFGHSAEKSMIPMRYQAGPISSIYIMQKENEMMREKMAQQEERIAQLEEMIMNMKK